MGLLHGRVGAAWVKLEDILIVVYSTRAICECERKSCKSFLGPRRGGRNVREARPLWAGRTAAYRLPDLDCGLGNKGG